MATSPTQAHQPRAHPQVHPQAHPRTTPGPPTRSDTNSALAALVGVQGCVGAWRMVRGTTRSGRHSRWPGTVAGKDHPPFRRPYQATGCAAHRVWCHVPSATHQRSPALPPHPTPLPRHHHHSPFSARTPTTHACHARLPRTPTTHTCHALPPRTPVTHTRHARLPRTPAHSRLPRLSRSSHSAVPVAQCWHACAFLPREYCCEFLLRSEGEGVACATPSHVY